VRGLLRSTAGRLEALGALPDDDVQRLRRTTLVLGTSLIMLLALVWVITYSLHGLWISAAIPFAYQCVSAVGLALVARAGWWRPFVTSQLAMMLVLPFALQWSLGGFVPSSGVGLWGLVAPLGAMMFVGAREAVPWFGAYLGLVVAALALDAADLVPGTDPLPGGVIDAFHALNIAAVSLTAFVLLQYFVRERDRAHAQVAVERERSERLLLNVLPASVADRLKSASGVIADAHASVSVLFADLVGFTPVAERLPADRVVEALDQVFSRFDELVERHGVEKIKTLGDGYMVAAGAPTPRTDHAEAIADLALEMREALTHLPLAQDLGLSLRVGIDSGPVVAGVIGRRRFSYDLWGDTVNTASRMESHAPDGGIQLTERAHAHLAGRYVTEPRDDVEVKGKGKMRTYLLLAGRRAGSSATGVAADPPAGMPR
jgi:adenylate cyclase